MNATAIISGNKRAPIALVIMGVSGCGKSTIAAKLASRLGWRLIEGDNLHPPANIAKMAAKIPLDDDDRAPWLARIAEAIGRQRAAGHSCVATCSALKRRYREAVIDGRDWVRFIYLRGDRQLIGRRLAQRSGHFMPPDLLDSQFSALEEPGAEENALTIDIGPPADELVEEIMGRLGLSGLILDPT